VGADDVRNRCQKRRFLKEALARQKRIQAGNRTAPLEPGTIEKLGHRLSVDDCQQLEPLAALSRVAHDQTERSRKSQRSSGRDTAGVTVPLHCALTAASGPAPRVDVGHVVSAIDNGHDVADPPARCVARVCASYVVV